MLESNAPVAVGRSVASVRLGEPPLGVLQLVFDGGVEPLNGSGGPARDVRRARGAGAAGRASRWSRREAELERTRALVAVISQAIAQLSLSHTLETAVERIAELLGVERVAVYLLEEGGCSRLPAAASSAPTHASRSGCSRSRSARSAAGRR